MPYKEEQYDKLRYIGEDLVRQGEQILGMVEASKVKKEDKKEDSKSMDKKGLMVAFLKKKGKKSE